MKKKVFKLLMLVLIIVGVMVSETRAASTVDLVELAIVDYATDGSLIPIAIDDNPLHWNNLTGLGSIYVSVNNAGLTPFSNNFLAYFDHEINQTVNGFSDEYGDAVNLLSKPANQSWEIDEPGYTFGDIYDNVTINKALDNTNSVHSGFPDDVSMALGWDFTLGAGESALVTLTVGEHAPASGFYLSQTDSSGDAIYYSSGLEIKGGGPVGVPEPSTLLLVVSGLAGLVAVSMGSRIMRMYTKVS